MNLRQIPNNESRVIWRYLNGNHLLKRKLCSDIELRINKT